MKHIIYLVAGTLTAFAAVAGPLQKAQVAENAKWVVHLDAENFFATQLGGFIKTDFLDKQLAKPARKLEEQFGIKFNWSSIKSLTAYGSDFEQSMRGDAVLVIKSGFDFGAAVNTVIEGLKANGAAVPVEKIQSEPYLMYSVGGTAFGAPFGKDVLLVSKSRVQLEQAREVLAGTAASLNSSKFFPAINNAPGGFLTVAVSDGFQKGTKLPPQASALQNAKSGQIAAGEKGDKVFVNLTLNIKDAESATQIQQVMQGLLALAVLTQQENKDLAMLVQGATVGGADKTVTLNLEVLSQTVIAKVSENQSKRRK